MAMELDLQGVTWQGPPVDDPSLLNDLPQELADLLEQINGFILLGGCLHVRGAVSQPQWHSLRRAWRDAKLGIPALYGLAGAHSVPFAQDCVGDQFLLRRGVVWILSSETAELTPTDKSLFEFLDAASSNPDATLDPAPLLRFQQDGGDLAPGRLLFAYPPFCTKQAADGVFIKDVPCDELISFHADLAKQMSELEDGAPFRISVKK